MTPWPKDLAHRKLTGVCAGLARGLGVSRVTVRVVALLALILMPPLALALYLVGCSSCLPAVNFNAGWGDLRIAPSASASP